MFLFLYGLLCILSKTLEDALEKVLFGVECAANVMSLKQLDLKVPVQQHHVLAQGLSQPGSLQI